MCPDFRRHLTVPNSSQAQPLYSQRVSLMTSTSRIALPCRTVGYGKSPCEVNRCIMFHSYVVCMCSVKKKTELWGEKKHLDSKNQCFLYYTSKKDGRFFPSIFLGDLEQWFGNHTENWEVQHQLRPTAELTWRVCWANTEVNSLFFPLLAITNQILEQLWLWWVFYLKS